MNRKTDEKRKRQVSFFSPLTGNRVSFETHKTREDYRRMARTEARFALINVVVVLILGIFVFIWYFFK